MPRRRFTLCLIFAWLAAGLTASAQKPDWIRNSVIEENSYGDTNAKRVAVHPDGSVFVLGQYSGSNDFNGQIITSSPGNTLDDAFLAKYSSNGDLIWIKQLFQSEEWYSNRVLDLKIDNQGDLVFSGSCLWPSSVLGSQTGVGYFLAKVDKDGNLKWLDFLPLVGGSLAEHDVSRRGNRIGFDPDGNILWLTDQINEFKPSGGLAVVKYSPDGVKLATMFVTRSATFYRPGIQDFSVDSEGNFVVSGNFTFTVGISGGPSLSNNGSNVNPIQFFIAKFARDGRFIWVVSSNKGSNLVTGHTVDNEGNVYMGLQLDAGCPITTPYGVVSVPSDQRPIARITSDGKLDWMNPVEFANVEDIFFAPDGLLYVTGTLFGSQFGYQSYVRSNSGDSGFILKVDTEGNFRGLYVGEPEDEPSTMEASEVYGYQSVVDATGDIYTIGDFRERQVWGCVPALTDEFAFFLVKHIPADSPVRTIEGPGPVCDGTEITLSTDLVSNGVLYKWFTPGAPSAPAGALLNNSISMIADAEYDNQPVIVSITDNCDEYFAEPYLLHVPAPPVPPLLTAGKTTVCPDTSEEFTIETDSGNSYGWTLPEGISAPGLMAEGGTFIFDSDFVAGEVKIAVSNSCGSSQRIFEIETYPTPGAPVLTGNLVLCPGAAQIQKSIQPVPDAVYYEWELPSHMSFNPLYPTNRITLNALADNAFDAGEITVRAVGVCKASEASLPIAISRAQNPGPAEALTGPPEICTAGGTVTYKIPAIEHANKYIWTLPEMFDHNGTISSTEPFIELKAQKAGTGLLLVHGESSCEVSGQPASMQVRTYAPLQKPLLSISPCDAVISVTSDETFSWYLNGTLAPNLSGKIVTLTDSGTYYVQVENFCGVIQSNMISAYPVLTSGVLIPNVITPNGDGKNDFLVLDKSLANSVVKVVTRWGESVYSSMNYQNEWSADDLTPGIYFITVNNPCLPQGYKGWLSVVK